MSTPKEKSLRKKKRLVLCVLFLFWGKGCSLKTSLGFGGEAAAGSWDRKPLQNWPLWYRIELIEEQQPSTECGGPARNPGSGRNPELQVHVLYCRQALLPPCRTGLPTAARHSKSQSNSANGLIQLASPLSTWHVEVRLAPSGLHVLSRKINWKRTHLPILASKLLEQTTFLTITKYLLQIWHPKRNFKNVPNNQWDIVIILRKQMDFEQNKWVRKS